MVKPHGGVECRYANANKSVFRLGLAVNPNKLRSFRVVFLSQTTSHGNRIQKVCWCGKELSTMIEVELDKLDGFDEIMKLLSYNASRFLFVW